MPKRTPDRILVIAAHPDDEVLGCGGTIRRHVDAGDDVRVFWMTDGTGSRKNGDAATRAEEARAATRRLGIRTRKWWNFPDQQLDTIPMAEIAATIHDTVDNFRPRVVYTHWVGDLNQDHRLTAQATLIATRPQPGQHVVAHVLGFEIFESTAWAFGCSGALWCPNVYIRLTEDQMIARLAAMDCYASEKRRNPHPRSRLAQIAQMTLRGAEAGCDQAEAFVTMRAIG